MSLLDTFEVIDAVSGVPTVSITKNGITFNKTVIEKLGLPEFAVVMIDKNQKQIAIVPCDENARGSRPFFKHGRDTSYGVRWNNYDLKKTLEAMMDWDLDQQGWKTTGRYLEDENALVFDLNNADPQRRI